MNVISNIAGVTTGTQARPLRRKKTGRGSGLTINVIDIRPHLPDAGYLL